MKSLIKLKNIIDKVADIEVGDISTNKNGVRYFYTTVRSKYRTTPKWVGLVFDKARKEAKDIDGVNVDISRIRGVVIDGIKYTFSFDRADIKGVANGKVAYSFLTILDNKELADAKNARYKKG